jgi:hypothetical protein
MKDLLSGGQFVGGEVVQAYVGGEDGLSGLYGRYLAMKLLEAYWSAQGAFFIYIPNVIGDCAKWHGNTGKGDVRRFCGSQGMLIFASINSQGQFTEPVGLTNDNIASIGGYGIRKFVQIS